MQWNTRGSSEMEGAAPKEHPLPNTLRVFRKPALMLESSRGCGKNMDRKTGHVAFRFVTATIKPCDQELLYFSATPFL